MKKSILFAAIIFLAVVNFSFGQRLTGNGHMVTKDFPIKSFNAVKISGVFNVFLTQGNEESVKVEIDDNLLNLFTITNEGEVLLIKWKKNNNENVDKITKNNVYITLKDIENLEFNAVGNVKTTNTLKLKDFKYEGESVGNADFDLNCESFKANIRSVGNLSVRGKAKNVKIENSSVGSVKAFDLMADVMDVESSGVGSVEVYAEKEISIESSGIGGVSYKGTAVVKNISSSGLGKIKKR